MPALLHALQAVLQALLQQTPWAQNVLVHSLPAEQVAPAGFRPHELMAPSMPQTLGAMHCVLVVHELKHLVVLQWYGKQSCAAGATHIPVALHVFGPVYRSVAQVSGPQTVPVAYR